MTRKNKISENDIFAKGQMQKLSEYTITFPACVLVSGYMYFRYLEDGRFEMHSHGKNNTTLTFGRIDPEWMAEEFSMLKTVVFRHQSITEDEYINSLTKVLDVEYQNFLQGVITETSQEETGDITSWKGEVPF
jgi:hypothetical protein